MLLNEEKKGEIFIFLGAVLWGLFPVITILSFNGFSPLMSLAGSTFFAAIFFAIMLTIRRRWREVGNRKAFKDILFSTLILGVLLYVLYFFALQYTSAGNVSIIALSEIFFSYLFFQIWHKVYMSRQHILGSIFMLLGALIILLPNFTNFRLGDILILLVAFIAPFGNYFTVRARKEVNSETIMFIRSLIAAPIILVISLIFETNKFDLSILGNSFLFLAINGFLLLGLSKIFWIEGIHRISVTKANARSEERRVGKE